MQGKTGVLDLRCLSLFEYSDPHSKDFHIRCLDVVFVVAKEHKFCIVLFKHVFGETRGDMMETFVVFCSSSDL